MIPYGKQDISEEDIKAVLDTLRSDFITQGPRLVEFEEKLSEITNAEYTTAVNSATSALHIACLSLGLKEGDYLWTSPNSFVASSNCALYCNAKVDFIDIDKSTYNISITALEEKLKKAKVENCLPKIVVPVHFSGASCDMQKIKQLSNQYGFKIIEDASHSIGATHKDSPVGSCEFSDITVFSFHPVKIITTGEGGAATTNDLEIYKKLCKFRTHGITKEQEEYIGSFSGPWKYEQHELGFNYRLTDLQANLGISQLNRLEQFIKRRREIAQEYFDILEEISEISLPDRSQLTTSSWHLFVIQLNESKIREQVFCYLRENGIGVNVHYIPIHLQPFYQSLGFKNGDFPCSEDYYSRAITLPLFPLLKSKDLRLIKEKLIEALSLNNS